MVNRIEHKQKAILGADRPKMVGSTQNGQFDQNGRSAQRKAKSTSRLFKYGLTPRRAADDHQSDHLYDIFKCAIAQQIDTL